MGRCKRKIKEKGIAFRRPLLDVRHRLLSELIQDLAGVKAFASWPMADEFRKRELGLCLCHRLCRLVVAVKDIGNHVQ